MSDEPIRKKIMIKKKGGAKPVIKLNKPAAEEETPTAEAEPKATSTEKMAPPAPVQDEKPPVVEKKPEPAPEPPPAPEKAKTEQPLFKFYCVYCGQKLSASPEMIGRTISCPACSHKIQVPTAP